MTTAQISVNHADNVPPQDYACTILALAMERDEETQAEMLKLKVLFFNPLNPSNQIRVTVFPQYLACFSQHGHDAIFHFEVGSLDNTEDQQRLKDLFINFRNSITVKQPPEEDQVHNSSEHLQQDSKSVEIIQDTGIQSNPTQLLQSPDQKPPSTQTSMQSQNLATLLNEQIEQDAGKQRQFSKSQDSIIQQVPNPLFQESPTTTSLSVQQYTEMHLSMLVGPLYDEGVICVSNFTLLSNSTTTPWVPLVVSSLDNLAHSVNAYCGTPRYICRSQAIGQLLFCSSYSLKELIDCIKEEFWDPQSLECLLRATSKGSTPPQHCKFLQLPVIAQLLCTKNSKKVAGNIEQVINTIRVMEVDGFWTVHRNSNIKRKADFKWMKRVGEKFYFFSKTKGICEVDDYQKSKHHNQHTRGKPRTVLTWKAVMQELRRDLTCFYSITHLDCIGSESDHAIAYWQCMYSNWSYSMLNGNRLLQDFQGPIKDHLHVNTVADIMILLNGESHEITTSSMTNKHASDLLAPNKRRNTSAIRDNQEGIPGSQSTKRLKSSQIQTPQRKNTAPQQSVNLGTSTNDSQTKQTAPTMKFMQSPMHQIDPQGLYQPLFNAFPQQPSANQSLSYTQALDTISTTVQATANMVASITSAYQMKLQSQGFSLSTNSGVSPTISPTWSQGLRNGQQTSSTAKSNPGTYGPTQFPFVNVPFQSYNSPNYPCFGPPSIMQCLVEGDNTQQQSPPSQVVPNQVTSSANNKVSTDEKPGIEGTNPADSDDDSLYE